MSAPPRADGAPERLELAGPVASPVRADRRGLAGPVASPLRPARLGLAAEDA